MIRGEDKSADSPLAEARPADVAWSEDVCALPLARRLAALVDRDPETILAGQDLPRGWHVMLFNTPTPQSRLRPDGAAQIGVTLPDLGLPRLMMGGRRIAFNAGITIGARVRRETRQGPTQVKEGRSGRFALVSVEHRIFAEGADGPAVVETNQYVLRAADAPGQPARDAPKTQAAKPDAVRSLMPDETMLFRYSAITDNPHRIHYDLAYARAVEGYPALLVNGSIPAMFLLEMFRDLAGREPVRFDSRNIAPMYCNQALTLAARHADGDEPAWRLWAENPDGAVTFEAQAR